MLLRALSLVIGALIFVSGTALAVDRGQFENVPDDIRAWFKGVIAPNGVPCCDISDGRLKRLPIRDYLLRQGRFAHFTDDDIAYFQSKVDEMFS